MAEQIRTRRVHKDIKALDKAAAAKEHRKHVCIRAKEGAGQTQPQEDKTPVEYAENKTLHGADRGTHKGVGQVKRQGQKAAAYIKEKREIIKEKEKPEKNVRERSSFGQEDRHSFSSAGREKVRQPKEQRTNNAQPQAGKQAAQQRVIQRTAQQKAVEKNGTQARELPRYSIRSIGQNGRTIKGTEKTEQTQKTTGKGMVKATGKSVKTAEQTARATVKTAQQSAKTAQMTAKAAKKTVSVARKAEGETAKATVRTTVTAVKTVIATTKTLMSAITAGGWLAVLILVIIVLFGAALCSMGGDNAGTVIPVSAEVTAYEPVIKKYADQCGIGEYVELVKAVMMQESSGKGKDPMQSSQSPYNQKYQKKPNGIPDPEYSIACGVQALKAALTEAEAENPLDLEHIRLALQGYNFGNGYISWAKSIYGGYTAANAAEFSEMMAEKKGLESYGDRQYAPHVLRYYAFGRVPAGTGNQAIVQMALAQEGNGGEIYWKWYGFDRRVEWCACFVSWCAGQCGYLESGIMPKFSLCSDGMNWFDDKGQFRDASYVPAAGDIIFFDWKEDGSIDHVGIVVNVENGMVNTIEGNSGDSCKRRSYPIGDRRIYGYGTPAY